MLKKCTFSILFTMLAMAGVANAATHTSTTPNQDDKGCYLISDADELYGFAKLVNAGNATACGKLDADIVVNTNVLGTNNANVNTWGQFTGTTPSDTWTPIGTSSTPFQGSFDGQGHTISGLYIKNSSENGVGLFGFVGGNNIDVSIKKLNITDSYYRAKSRVGVLVGYVFADGKLTIENVSSNAAVSSSYDDGTGYIGGLIGYVENATANSLNLTITGVHNDGLVIGKDYSGSVHNYVGGLVGGTSGLVSVTVANSFNTGNITGSSYVGGLIGGVKNPTSNTGIILNITNAYNTGTIKGSSINNIGGLVGRIEVDYSESSVEIRNCYNYGSVDGFAITNTSTTTLGQISFTPINCYYLAEESNGFGMSANDFADGTVFALLRSGEDGEVWYQYDGDVYPDFTQDQGKTVIPAHVATLHYSENEIEKIPYVEGEAKALPSTHQYTDATIFQGWFNNQNFTGDAATEIPADANTNLNFYAKTKTIPVVDGCYQISDADMLYKFADMVNNQNYTYGSACAKLTQNIRVNQNVLTDAMGVVKVDKSGAYTGNASAFRVWTPIGSAESPFAGTFDGQGHTISGLYFNNSSADNVGLFGYTSGAVTIDSVGVVDSYFRGDEYVGSIVGQAALVESKKLTVTRSYNKGFVKGTSNVGGLVGKNGNVKFSYNKGAVTGTDNVGGLVGSNIVNYKNNFEINGSYNVGLVKMGDGMGNAVLGEGCPTGSQTSAVRNVYYLGGSGDECSGAFSMTSYEFADGFVAITLHDDRTVTGADIWGQVVGTDKTPVLTGEIVFPITLDNSDNCYEISNADDLYIFAAIVNSGFKSDACGKLTENIVVNENVLTSAGELNTAPVGGFKEWTPIGLEKNSFDQDISFRGTFHGQGHTISGLYFNDADAGDVGLFGDVSGTVTIDSVGLVDSYIMAGSYVGGLVGFARGSLTISNSYNASSVTSFYTFGGLVGAAGKGSSLAISNSYNVGSLNGKEYGGGLVGYANALVVSNSYNAGSIYISDSGEGACVGGITSSVDDASTVTNSFNYGTISYPSNIEVVVDDLVAGGGEGEVTVTNSYFIGESEFKDNGATQKSATEFADGTVFAALRNAEDGEVWRQYKNDAYPTFAAKTGTGAPSPMHVATLHYSATDSVAIPYTEGTAKPLPTKDPEGNAIVGWTTSADGSGNVITEIPTSATTDLKLYPKIKTFEPNAEGYYEIATADDLYKFAEIVNNGTAVGSGTELGVKAKLIADICVNACGEGESVLGTDNANVNATTGDYIGAASASFREWTPIGIFDNPFNGTFDGQGHTISGLYFNDDEKPNVGLFGYVSGEGVTVSISNVGVEDSYFNAQSAVGGVVGWVDYASLDMKNVYNAAVVVGASFVGGVVGYVGLDSQTLSMTNVYNVGLINCEDVGQAGGLVGEFGNDSEESKVTIKNSYNYGEVVGGNSLVGYVESEYENVENVSVSNSYYLGDAAQSDYGTKKSSTEFADGTVFAALYNAEDGEVWRQYSDDDYPTLAEKKGTGVVPMHVITLHLPEKDSVFAYTEGAAGLLPAKLDDGSILIWYKSDDLSGETYTQIAATENGDLNFYAKAMKLDSDGYYEIADADMLFKFAELVNTQNSTYRSAKVKLTADIVVNEHVLADANGVSNVNSTGAYIGSDSASFRKWTPIGNSTNRFQGAFDGQGHTISGLYVNEPQACSGECPNSVNIGLFGAVANATDDGTVFIRNVGVEDSYFAGHSHIGGIVGDFNSEGNLNIENSYSVATIYATAQSGGLAGYIQNTNVKIEDSYSYGDFKCGSNCGALVGYLYSANVNVVNSFYLEGVSENWSGDFGTAASIDAFANGTVATLLHGDGVDADSVWGQNVTGGESHPTFFKGINVEDGPGVITGGPETFTITLLYPDATASSFTYVEGWGATLPEKDKNGDYVIWYDDSRNFYNEVSSTVSGDLDLHAVVFKLGNDGFYEIDDVAKLYKFAAIVNGGNGDVNAKLSKDIEVNKNVLATEDGVSKVNSDGTYIGSDSASFREWTPIGYCDEDLNCLPFTGIFDGQGHTISGLYYNDEDAFGVGLFGYVEGDGSTIIKNVGVEDSYFKALDIAGGILGEYGGGNVASIENVYSAAVVVAGEDAWIGIGGVVGSAWDGYLTVTNAYNVGSVIGGSSMGGIVGDIVDCSATIKNSFNYGDVAGDEPLVGSVADADVSVTNSYYLGDAAQGDYGTVKSADEFADGTVFAALRGADESGSWYQYQGDAYPSLSTKSGTPIHAVTLAFSETDVQYIPYVQGVATSLPTEDKDGNAVIGWTASADGTGDVITEIPASATTDLKLYAKVETFKPNAEGFYEIASADDLYKFAELVNSDKERDAKAKLMNDIVVNENVLATAGGASNVDATTGEYTNASAAAGFRKWTPIGTHGNAFKGAFDGQGYTISGLYFNDSEAEYVGLFGYVLGNVKNPAIEVSIANVGVEDSYFNGKNYVGGVIGSAVRGVALDFENIYSTAVVVGTSYVGGIAGEIAVDEGSADATLNMTNAYHSGSVIGSSNVGGLVGKLDDMTSATIKNAYSYDENVALLGSVTGSPSVTNSYYLADEVSGSYGSNASASDFENGTVLAALRSGEGGYVWVQAEGDKYPTIDINASKNANTIVLDWTNAADSTTLADAGYTAGAMVIVKDGKKFYANGAIYEGILSAGQVTAIGDKMLHPVSGIELATVNNELVATVNADSDEPLMIPTDVKVSEVVYERVLTKGVYATIMVPFSVPVSSVSGFSFYKFKRVGQTNEGKWAVYVSTVKDSLRANTPYIIVASNNATQITFKLDDYLTLNTTSDVYETTNGNWTMKGVYERKDFLKGDPELGKAYGFAGDTTQVNTRIGRFVRAGDGSYVLPMGVYLVYEEPKMLARPGQMGSSFARINVMPENISVEIEDEEETTVVKHITVAPTFVKSSDRWFDMKGRSLGEKPTAKGTYYHNGQRVIIK